MRYKCVIPIVIDQEAKEREKQEKKEEKEKKEEDSIIKIENEYLNETEINESKNRVYEHFKKMSQTNKQVKIPPKKKKKSKNLILNQIHGGKRKREFDIGNEIRKKNNDNDFATVPVPHFDAGTVHMSKKAKQEVQTIERQKMQESLTQVQSNNNSETVKSIR